MATRKAAQKDQTEATGTTSDLIEKNLVAFAGQLGYLVGTIQSKAEGWLDREALSKEVARIRDSAAHLLDQMNREGQLQRKAAAKRPTSPTPTPTPTVSPASAAPATRPSRGPVDAPGKRHRKPPPQESINKRMGEPTGKKMGQKSAQNRMRSGRG